MGPWRDDGEEADATDGTAAAGDVDQVAAFVSARRAAHAGERGRDAGPSRQRPRRCLHLDRVAVRERARAERRRAASKDDAAGDADDATTDDDDARADD